MRHSRGGRGFLRKIEGGGVLRMQSLRCWIWSQQGIEALDQGIGFEGFCDVIIGSRSLGLRGVEGVESAGQKNHGDAGEFRALLNGSTDLIAVPAGQADIGQYNIWTYGMRDLDGLVAVARRDQFELQFR